MSPPIYGFALHPVFVTSFIVMLVNDHLLRPSGIMPVITGKISDVAILIFLPAAGALILVYAKYMAFLLCRMFSKNIKIDYRLAWWMIAVSTFVTAAVFVSINISQSFNEGYAVFINKINFVRFVFPLLDSTRDITDLFTLPSVVVSVLILRKCINQI